MIKLHDNKESGNAYKIRLLLNQLDVPFLSIQYDVTKGETRTPEFLAKVSPIGRIPAVEFEDGRILAESNANLFYFSQGTSYFPEDRFEQAEVMKWMFFEQYSHEPYIAVAKYILTMLPEKTSRKSEIPNLHKNGYAALKILEDALNSQDFLVGRHYSIADICLYAYTHCAAMGGFDLSDYQNINAWINRVQEQEKYISMY